MGVCGGCAVCPSCVSDAAVADEKHRVAHRRPTVAVEKCAVGNDRCASGEFHRRAFVVFDPPPAPPDGRGAKQRDFRVSSCFRDHIPSSPSLQGGGWGWVFGITASPGTSAVAAV